MAETAIEWTDRVWNPTTGCDRVSPGCDHCYAMTMAKRLKGMGSAKYQRDGDPKTSGPGFGVTMHYDSLEEPLRWRKPQRVFVNSMSDLFHDDISDEFIARVWAVMALAPQHTFQVLTKRHARMRTLLKSDRFWRLADISQSSNVARRDAHGNPTLTNVWLGVSAENQQWADIRIPALIDTPAAVRFVSAEPLLGPINLHTDPIAAGSPFWGSQLDWVIAGGESGRNDRPIQVAWVRDIRDQCQEAGVAFLFKQWGETVPLGQMTEAAAQRWDDHHGGDVYPPESLWRVGKKAAGRELDGRTWDQYPGVATA